MAQNQSPSRLSMAAITSLSRDGAWASRTAVVVMPANGTARPTASPRAAARPTRTPVKLPGPMVTAMSESARRSTRGIGKHGLDRRQQACRLVSARLH